MPFHLPFPTLTRVHSPDGSGDLTQELETFLKEHITLVIFGQFNKSEALLKVANKLCTEDGAHEKQRTLWIRDIKQLSAINPRLEEFLKRDFPDKEIDFNNVRAVSVIPESIKLAYVIYIDPSLSPDPKDKFKKLSAFQMLRAFNKAILGMPQPDDQ